MAVGAKACLAPAIIVVNASWLMPYETLTLGKPYLITQRVWRPNSSANSRGRNLTYA